MAEVQHADANIFLRLLLDDDEAKAEAVEAYLGQPVGSRPDVVVTVATISEIVYVLRSPRLGHGRARVADGVALVLDLPVRVSDRDVVERAVQFFRHDHDDWDDCVVAAYATERAGGRLLSFDRGLGRIPGLRREEPSVAAAGQ